MESHRRAGTATRLTEMMTAGPHHFAIKVRDLGAAERFYRDILGLRVVRRWPAAAGGGDRSVWLATGDAPGTFLALETVTGPSSAAASTSGADGGRERNNGVDLDAAELPGHHLLALRIDQQQRATWVARLEAAGVTIHHRTEFTIYFRDPEGNRLGLSHHPDPTESI